VASRKKRTAAPRLTPKELERLRIAHTAIVRGTFDEGTVAELLWLLRFQSYGALREIGNFIAHAERDSGEFLKRIAANAEALENLGKRSGVVDARHVIPAERFATDLNSTLARVAFGMLSRETSDFVLLCCLSRLQGATVKTESRSGELSLVVHEGRCSLVATAPFNYNGRTSRFRFPVSAVPSAWLPVCNPRAHVRPTGLVSVRIIDGKPDVVGFAPFEVHFERAPPISLDEVDALHGVAGLRRTQAGLEYVGPTGSPMVLRYDGSRLTVAGLPEFFAPGSATESALRDIRQRLGACVHDDGGAHWFLDGLALAPDGYHCHWVGAGSATCTRPA
jgi:hypothetical protein